MSNQELLRPPDKEAEADVLAAIAACEPQEAALWSAAFTSCGAMPGNPLGAAVLAVGRLTCSVSKTLDFPSFNRVLGITSPDDLYEDRIREIAAFYAANGQNRFRIEIAQPLLDSALTRSLAERGIAPVPESMAKSMRTLRDLPDLAAQVPVRLLSQEDRDAFVAVNRLAWGLPGAFRSWYEGSFDVPDLHHFGVEVAGQIVAVGSLYVTGRKGWIGYGAVLPDHQGHRYQRAIMLARVHHARALGCEMLHAETRSEVSSRPNPSLRSALSSGFTYMYDRSYFEPIGAGPAPDRDPRDRY